MQDIKKPVSLDDTEIVSLDDNEATIKDLMSYLEKHEELLMLLDNDELYQIKDYRTFYDKVIVLLKVYDKDFKSEIGSEAIKLIHELNHDIKSICAYLMNKAPQISAKYSAAKNIDMIDKIDKIHIDAGLAPNTKYDEMFSVDPALLDANFNNFIIGYNKIEMRPEIIKAIIKKDNVTVINFINSIDSENEINKFFSKCEIADDNLKVLYFSIMASMIIAETIH